MSRYVISALAGLGLILSGCSGGGDGESDTSLLVSVTGGIGQTIKARQARSSGSKGPVVVTRKLLDETPAEVIEVVPDQLGTQDFLLLLDRRRDNSPGVIEIWKSSDNALVTTRDGVVINTRGLGGDLRSSTVASAVSGFDGQGGGGQRRMQVARADGVAETIVFSCNVTQLGREVLQIVDQRVPTYHLREDCVHEGVRITNEYWAETAGGRLRKSRQWVSPIYGYVAITRLKN